eukprot:15352000-Ditylum_brightwellii.AAC.1
METLKELKNVLIGQQIKVYTVHKNLTYKNVNTSRVIWWRMVLEDYALELIYTPGNKNVVADLLSHLDKYNCSQPPSTNNGFFLLEKALMANDIKDLNKEEILLGAEKSDDITIAECYINEGESTIPLHIYPLSFKLLQKEQQKYKTFWELSQGADKSRSLICQEGKIIIPLLLCKQVLDWYHATLCHPGAKHMELTMHQHFRRKNLSNDIKTLYRRCLMCCRTKQQYTKYGWLLEKQSNDQPWETLCIDLIERAHQTIGNLLHTFEPGSTELEPEGPWGNILST